MISPYVARVAFHDVAAMILFQFVTFHGTLKVTRSSWTKMAMMVRIHVLIFLYMDTMSGGHINRSAVVPGKSKLMYLGGCMLLVTRWPLLPCS